MTDPYPTQYTLTLRWVRIGGRMCPVPLPEEVRRAASGLISADRILRVDGPTFVNVARCALAHAWYRFVAAIFPL